MNEESGIEDRARLHDAAVSAEALPQPPLRRRIVEAVLGRGDAALHSTLSKFLASENLADAIQHWFGSGIVDLASRSGPEALRRTLDRELAALDILLNDQLDAI